MSYPFIASPNFNSRKLSINMILIHFTASGSLNSAVSWFKNPAAKASSHYVVGRDGSIVQMVYLKNRAWHAGKAEWKGCTDINSCSIGIEICNWGILKEKDGKYYCWPNDYKTLYTGPNPLKDVNDTYWEPYADEQIKSCIKLIKELVEKYEIPKEMIVGHSDVAPGRKDDPGYAFPWKKVKEEVYPKIIIADRQENAILPISSVVVMSSNGENGFTKFDSKNDLERYDRQGDRSGGNKGTFCGWFSRTFG